MFLTKLKEILKDEPTYRYKQVNAFIFKNFITDWEEASSLPFSLREKLQISCPLDISSDIHWSSDRDSAKALIKLEDNNVIESVLIRNRDKRITICVSAQAGCPLGCSFCATGKMGFKRNLDFEEIVIQVLLWEREIRNSGERVDNIVFMGQGEPLLNYDNVIKAVKVFNDPERFNIGARKISLSTSGIIEGIERLSKEKLQFNLALSLHAPNDDLRSNLMPINEKYGLKKIFRALDNYIERNGRKVMLEYIMINKVNDSPELARELADLLKGRRLYMVNLIKYNDAGLNNFTTSTPDRIKKFKEILINSRIEVVERHSAGSDLWAACGQLANRNNLNK
ncbi:MAG: 23S rRNA (adenine(2503)-C(2))-methyltransferase RlmN [Planctomycetes bacterium]|jgi:23S rRNA (adenine2503-C2)-methyltransferase|nr:23S rRNA (adenine(2503)-C(2))-methyltransferase RlmN [Planctomycetota bacterium]